jgi:iron(III) transport system substrate-binding protein
MLKSVRRVVQSSASQRKGWGLLARAICLLVVGLAAGRILPELTRTRVLAFAQQQESAMATVAEETWEKRWKETIAKAKQEGKTVMEGRKSYEWGPVFEPFEKKFGVKVEIVDNSDSNRFMAENRAKRYNTDHALWGTVSARNFIQNGLLKPLLPELILPEMKDPAKWLNGHLWWADADPKSGFMILFASPVEPVDMKARYNTKNVTQAEVDSINSVWDFLNPRWKGRIVTHAFEPMPAEPVVHWAHPDIGREWFVRFLTEMQPTFYQDDKQIIDGLIAGAFDLALFNPLGVDKDMDHLAATAGAPIDAIRRHKKPGQWKEGVMLNTGTANRSINIVKNAPHPNAARLVVNWLLSKEGQIAWHERFAIGKSRTPYPSFRVDVTEPGRTDPTEDWRNAKRYVELPHKSPKIKAIRVELLKLYKKSR